jgi:PAS domain S-box-containing protein
MPGENKNPTNSRRGGSAWNWTHSSFARYAFAVVLSAAVFALRFEAERLADNRFSIPLCGLGAVIFCIWRAGFGPAVLTTVLTTAWYVYDFRDVGADTPRAFIHYALYITEAAIVCTYGRQLSLAKDEAEKGEQWLRHLVETAGEGIWLIGLDGSISYANPRIAEILRCPVNRIIGHRLDEFLFPGDRTVERVRLQHRRAGNREQFDRRLRRPDGSEVWTLACSSPYSLNNEPVGALSMMTDITERKQAEYALRQSERKYRELFENILEGVYQTSPDGRVLAANPELLRMLGFSSPDEMNVPGVVRDTFVDPDQLEALRDKLERDGSYANVEFQLRTRDQRFITVRENARVVRDELGNVLYYEGTLTDITEQLNLEKQLRLAQKMEAVGRLAGGIARDFRSVGAGMMNGLQQALQVLTPDSPARAGLEAVAKSMHSAAALTRQLLEFSQRQSAGDAGRQSDAAIDVNALVQHLTPSLIRLVNPDNALALSLCESPTPVFADAGHMQHIVTSFIVHARQFGTGARKIDLSTAIEPAGPTEAKGPFVSLSVHCRATGTGDLEPEFRPWIGMATTQAILAQYGGTMTAVVSAEPDVRYSLYLPLALGAGPATTPALPAGPEAGTVLLVEEEPLIRELSRDMLERQGFRVFAAGSAAEAERIARGDEAFDVLITAWTPDGRRGSSLAQVLRDMRPDLHVLFIAGYTDESLDSVVLPEGSAILRKPFSGDSLGRKVRQLL